MTDDAALGHPVRLTRADAVTRLINGLELQAGLAVLRITALSEGVLRVQAAADGVIEQRESWAVLPHARQRFVPVTHRPESAKPESAAAVGFDTAELAVTIRRDPLHMTITDRTGRVLLEDAPGRATEFLGPTFRMHKASPPNEHYFGLGDKPGRLDRRNRAFRMWNTDDPFWAESSDLLYKTVPFLLGLRDGRAWGLLLDNTWRSFLEFDVTTPDTFSFGAEGGAPDVLVLAGPKPRDVLRRFVDLTGPMPLPPLWALGFGQSRYSYPSQARVLEVADEHRRRGIPLDAVWLDIGFQDRNRPFTVDRAAFPDLPGMVARLRDNGVRTVAITDLHVAAAPDGDYSPFRSGQAGDHFLRNPDGSVFVGESWPGDAVFPEFGRTATRAWWGGLYAEFYRRDGIAGFWNDMNEPSVRNGPGKTMPPAVRHRLEEPGHAPRTATHAEMHNAYGLQNTRATYEGLRGLDPERRPFVLTRASYAGGHRYAATWTGDNASTWQHLRLCVPQLLNLGLSGFALSGCDVGGFGGSPSPDLLTRWVQLGAFTPFFRNHTALGTADQEAWVHGAEHEALRRRAIEARYRLLPYLYALAAEAAQTGTPMMRPMFLEFPDDEALATEDSQFMLGPALLVAPWPDETREAYPLRLPANTQWYDYWTGRRIDASQPVMLEKRLDHLAVFARAGSIVPHQPLVQSTAQTPDGPPLLHVYPAADGQDTMVEDRLYCDDGISFDHQRDGFFRQAVRCARQDGQIRLFFAPPEGRYVPWWRETALLIHGVDRPVRRIEVNERALPSADVDQDRHAICFGVETNGGATVRVELG